MRVGDTLTDHEGVQWIVVDKMPAYCDDEEVVVLQSIPPQDESLFEADNYRTAS